MNYYKKIYMEYIYDKVCYQYMKDENISIKQLEKIIFLANIDSIEKDDFDFLKCKIFCFDNIVRIEYLSDLFRVMKPQEIQKNRIFKIKRIDKVSILLEKYINMDEEEIDNLFKFRINQGKYNKVFLEEYKSRRNRKYARMRSYSFSRKIRTIENKVILILIFPFALSVLFYFDNDNMRKSSLVLLFFVLLIKFESIFYLKIRNFGRFNGETDFEKELQSIEDQQTISRL